MSQVQSQSKQDDRATWQDDRATWQQRMRETGDLPHPVPMPDGTTVFPEVYIVSIPKSGRTWLRVLIGKALIETYKLDEKDLLEPLKLTVAANILPTEFIHDGTNVALGLHWKELGHDKSAYQDKKVIFLVREPKDLLVSSYFSAANRKGIYDGSISEFIRSDEYGIKKLTTFYKTWSDNQSVPQDFLLLRYSDLHNKPEASLESVLKFMGADDVTPEIVSRAIEFGSFNNMKSMEKSGEYNWRLSSPDLNDNESYKVRKGKVGGYAEYLSQEDIEYIDRSISESGISFFG
jgi:hypothetical protein